MPEISPGQARPPVVFVLDIGSSSVRAALYDALARPVSGLQDKRPYALNTSIDGGVEIDPAELVQLVIGSIDETLARAGPLASGVAGVGMACFASSLVGVDRAGTPLTPLYAYSDTRPAADVAALRDAMDEEQIHERTGCRLHTSYLPARLRWLKRTAPDIFRSVDRWLCFPEYLLLHLTGAVRCSPCLASWTGLLNRHTLDWDSELLDMLGLRREALAPIGEQPLGPLLPDFAKRWPALARAPWLPGWADGAAANIGAGCTSPSEIALSIGTTGAMRVVTPNPPARLPGGLWCYRVDSRRALVGGAINEGGGVVSWLRDTLRFEDFEADEAAIGRSEPDAHGLTVLPFLTGERSPGWNAGMRAAITGITAATTPRDILQAILESIAYRFGIIADQLVGVMPRVSRIVAGGGGASNSPVWMQIIADVLNRPIDLADETETTSRGVAILTLAALGVDAGAIPPPVIERGFVPNPERHARYRAAIERQQRLYHLLADWGRHGQVLR